MQKGEVLNNTNKPRNDTKKSGRLVQTVPLPTNYICIILKHKKKTFENKSFLEYLKVFNVKTNLLTKSNISHQ